MLYAYSVADPNVIKSLTLVNGPYNLRQFATHVDNMAATFNCNVYSNSLFGLSTGLFCSNTITFGTPLKLPKFFPIVTTDVTLTMNYYNNSCTYPPLSNSLIFEMYNMIQSAMGTIIANPATSTDLEDYSPPIAVSSVNIPTFILHGLKDVVVPHQNCRDDVASLLNANGGLLAQNNVCHNTAMPSMGSDTHLERLYSGTGHGLIVYLPGAIKTQMFNRVRSDMVNWIIAH